MNPFEREVRASLETILTNHEPDFCDSILGSDEVSSGYPPHKAVRLVVSLLLVRTVLILETQFLVGLTLVLSTLMLPLSMWWRLASAITLFVTLLSMERFWVPKRLFPSIERACLYWRYYSKR